MSSTGDEASGKQIRVLVRAIDILDTLSAAHGHMGVSEIGRATGLSKSTVHNLLETLVGAGLVLPDPTTRRYAIGGRATRWATAFLESIDVARVAQPHLEALRDLTGETAYLFIRSGFVRICVGQALSRHGLRRQLTVGETRPLWSAATGSVLMSGLPDAVLADYLASADIDPLTLRTLTAPSAIAARAREARDVGWVAAFDETEIGVAGIAFVVRDHRGDVAASATVSGPTQRWSADEMYALVPDMLEIAGRMSSQMGWRQDDGAGATVPGGQGQP